MRGWCESTAGIDARPVAKSQHSATAVIVVVVPAVLQVPGLRVMQLSSSCQSSSGRRPARRSFQNFMVWVPVPPSRP